MLMGAFLAIFGADKIGSWVVGLLAAMVAGGLLALVHAFFSIHLRADQIVSGTAINFLALGITGYFFVDLYGDQGTPCGRHPSRSRTSTSTSSADSGHRTFLEDVFGHLNLMIWLSFLAPRRLVLRAVQDADRAAAPRRSASIPRAADTVGIYVYAIRYVAVVVSGMLAALGGAYLSIGFLGSFNENMTAGRGFIALAAVIFGNWRPFGAFGAALLFGFSTALAQRLPEYSDVGGDALPGAAVRPDADRRRRRDRPLDPARSRRATLRQAVAGRNAPARLRPSCSACSLSAAIPVGGGVRRSAPERRADLGGRGSRPSPRVLGLAALAAARRRTAPSAADRSPQRCRGPRVLADGSWVCSASLFAGTGAISPARVRILSWRGRTSASRRIVSTIVGLFEIGNSLREARLRQSLELTEVERATKIRPKYLRALEDEQFELLPAQTYVKGFLRTYAEFLGLDGQLYVDEYNSRYVTRRGRGAAPAPQEHAARAQPRLESSVVLVALVGIAVVFALVIAAWKSGDDSPEHERADRRHRAAARPPSRRARRRAVRAARRACEVRRNSQEGRARLLRHDRSNGREQSFKIGQKLWLYVQRPAAVDLVVNGRAIARAPARLALLRRLGRRARARRELTRPRALLVVTGSELVRGDRRDRNGPFLAREIARARARAGADHHRGRRRARARSGASRGARRRPPRHVGRPRPDARRPDGRAARARQRGASSASTRSSTGRSSWSRAASPSGCGARTRTSSPGYASRRRCRTAPRRSASRARRRAWCSSTAGRSSWCCPGRRASCSGSGPRRAQVRADAGGCSRARGRPDGGCSVSSA